MIFLIHGAKTPEKERELSPLDLPFALRLPVIPKLPTGVTVFSQ
jgi:hypothetical protein